MENGNTWNAEPIRPRGLGRGLESLFSDSSGHTDETGIMETQEDEKVESKVLVIDINQIFPNPEQPRRRFEDEKIEELAASLKGHGMIQPILVKKAEKGYEIIAGERRWRAARRADLKQIPCIIKTLDEKQYMLISLIENMQRENLNALEEATAFESMMDKFHMTQEEISRNIGKSRPYIANALRLLKLPREIQDMVIEGKMSGGHARALVAIDRKEMQIAAAEEIIEKGLSVRQAEAISANQPAARKKKPTPAKREAEIELSNIESEMRATLGTKVKIHQGNKRGKIEIEYYSMEELERLIELILSIRD